MAKDMPGRMLSLLSLLQSRRDWGGAELADRLEVTVRTIRRDVERLRELGYPVEATAGTLGGYRLASGQNLPPLLLDDEEAVAVGVGLHAATAGGFGGIEDPAVRAIAKLGQVFPNRLRRQVDTLVSATEMVTHRGAPSVDPAVLTTIASGCREREQIEFGYHSRSGEHTRRRVEPHRLVASHGLWYLIGYDLDRSDWRMFRLDRMSDVGTNDRPFRPRELPGGDAAAFVARTIAATPYPFWTDVTLQAPAEVIRQQMSAVIPQRVEPLDAGHCRVRLGSDSPGPIVHDLAALASLDVSMAIVAADEVITGIRTLSERLRELATHGTCPAGPAAVS